MIFTMECVSIPQPHTKEWLQHLKHSHASLAIWMFLFELVKEIAKTLSLMK